VSTYCECIGVEVADLSFYKYEPLCDKSLARVYEGLIKYVAGGQKAFIQQRNGGEPASRVTDLDQPSRTLTATGGNLQLVQTNAFLSKYFSGDAKTMNISTDGPCGSVTTKDHHSLVQVVDRAFITKYLSNNSKTGSNPGASISHPAPTITTQNRLGLVQVTDSNMVSSFISQYYSNGGQHSDVESPCGSLTTKDRMCLIQAKRLLHLNQGSEGVKSGVKANWLDKNYSGKANHESVEQPAGAILSKPKFSLVTSHFIDKQFSSGAKNQSVEEPHGSLLTVPKSNLVRIERGWLMNTNFNNVGSSLQGPAPTLVASRRHSYLIQGVFAGQEQDASTLNLYRHGQAPAHLLCDESGGSTVILVFDTDSELVVKIKEFMSIYGITDIKLRMLFVRELLRIQGFPGDYFLAGSQSDQKKFIGNSVVPVVPKKWLEALAGELFEYTQMKLAA
jgi:DNA (cytosine-5)-methyltransferase 1